MSAKEMFEELGYKFEQEEDFIRYSIKYFISEIVYIEFDLLDKTIRSYKVSDSPFTQSRDVEINLKELQAINKQVEELRWNK